MIHLNDDKIHDCDNVRKIMRNVLYVHSKTHQVNLKEKHFDFKFSTPQFSHDD